MKDIKRKIKIIFIGNKIIRLEKKCQRTKDKEIINKNMIEMDNLIKGLS